MRSHHFISQPGLGLKVAPTAEMVGVAKIEEVGGAADVADVAKLAGNPQSTQAADSAPQQA